MFRNTTIATASLQFARRKFLANASIGAEQSTVGIITKPINGYTAIFLDLLAFAENNDIENQCTELSLDNVINN